MIKVYKIKVAEKVYEVEVEAITEKEGKIASSAPATSAAPVAPVAVGEGTKIEAPMQGKILDV
ncbi:MAG: acetyl-CoA carboxylase biotin carboxyl carrier protein subunit, partial [Fusobacteriaceae bacterium]